MRTPTNWGPLDGASTVGAVGNPACGDVVTIYLRIQDGTIEAASFESMGSAYQLATASVLCDCVTGQDIAGARARTPECVLEKLPDLPQRHRYLARLALDGLQKALDALEDPKPPAPGPVDESGGRAFVVRILGNGKAWTTREIEAMAEAEAIDLPQPTVAFLARLKESQVIDGAMDVARRSMVWSLHGPQAP